MASPLRSLLRAGCAASSSRVSTRAFSGAAVRCAGKESALHIDGDTRAADVAKQAARHVEAAKRGEAAWEDGLASDSESAVKADRGESETTSQAAVRTQRQQETVEKEMNQKQE